MIQRFEVDVGSAGQLRATRCSDLHQVGRFAAGFGCFCAASDANKVACRMSSRASGAPATTAVSDLALQSEGEKERQWEGGVGPPPPFDHRNKQRNGYNDHPIRNSGQDTR